MPFVNLLEISVRGNHQSIENPSWEETELAIRQQDRSRRYRSVLWNSNEYVCLNLEGGAGEYHIGIIYQEADIFYYWNGAATSDEVTSLGGNLWPSHQVCRDVDAVVQIAKAFFETGERCDDLKWLPDAINTRTNL